MKPASPVYLDDRHLPAGCDEVRIAEDQPQYETLPAVRLHDPQGTVITRWELTDEEIQEIIKSRSIYLTMMTFGHPVTPVLLSTDPPEIIELPALDAESTAIS